MEHTITLNKLTPKTGKNTFFAPNSFLVGDVVCGDDCSFWFNTVVRGDVNSIRMGDRVNVQDGSTIHCTYQKTKTIIGNDVSIGHNAIVHGCTLEDNVLIGMGAIVMDNAVVGKNALVAAGAVVLEGTKIPPNTIFAGVPAKKVKEIEADTFADMNQRIAANYIKYASWYKKPSED
jgi:carbonic anhydrase/acetyltransferase-like protein (isoleucine patch superfamily)